MPPRKRLGQLLTELKVIDEHQLQSALGHQKQWGGKLGVILVQKGFCTRMTPSLPPHCFWWPSALCSWCSSMTFNSVRSCPSRLRGGIPISVQRFTRARYSSREKTPFSMSSSTMAFKAATERRWVSSTPRSTSNALARTLFPSCAGAGGGCAFFPSTVTTEAPLLLTILIDDSS